MTCSESRASAPQVERQEGNTTHLHPHARCCWHHRSRCSLPPQPLSRLPRSRTSVLGELHKHNSPQPAINRVALPKRKEMGDVRGKEQQTVSSSTAKHVWCLPPAAAQAGLF